MSKKPENEESNKPAKKNTSKKNKGKPKSGLIFWLAFAVIIVIAFLVARGRIASVLRETDFINEVVGTEPTRITDLVNSQAEQEDIAKQKKAEKAAKSKKPKKAEKAAAKAKKNQEAEDELPQEIQRTEADLEEREEITIKANKQEKIEKTEKAEKVEKNEVVETPKTEEAPKAVVPETMHINLCFVQIDDSDGSIIRRETIRTVEKNTSPLTTALNALITGPNASEAQKGYISIIPPNTKLLGARITNKTAILNFNEDFTYNSYGVQGQITQLMQIVYTATSFSTIDNVQFLIEGQKIDYLGGEGVWIGSPLSRFSFK
ncbi:MAG: GerMN domain-containing protein [Treponemataceae bacterium]|nr:GerMN domain-containing protein [Treponemataceae bacterium]